MILFLSLSRLLSSDQVLRKNIGQDVAFSCFFENESQFDQVSFMHQTTGDLLSLGSELFIDKPLTNNHIKLIRFSSNRLDLNIFSVNQNDSGLYTCMHNDEKLSSFLLEIFVPPRFISFSPVGATVSYPEGSSMNLSCHAHAFPSTNITWIYRNKNKQFRTIHYAEDLYISSLGFTDSGSYECIASNGYHEKISRSFYVTVQYPPRVMIKKFINFFIKPVQLNCEICSMPLPQTEWLRNGKSILNEQHFIINTNQISIENEECLLTVLTIHESLHENYGRYECRAENFLGHHSDHIDFNQKFTQHTRSQHDNVAPSVARSNTKISPNSSICYSQLINRFLISILLIINLLL
ncbi:unnamed protein product [Rotaria magnacalcarata]|uniref:Ig-like domain-containing protein n=1 Tax=Rotaria magnacalcarata TaxID=392030 RepID=A0A815ZGE7_9BILA|nr:unnamed protein product [Rotaria magnacalcarata]CAF1622590.1 unnamed protein product [Rotaria magnacalcarata]CAF2041261.1 unnamed protein product [Rotaria magnacalcarata]CAF2117166.1 unnamed protein product [Rotaria magnacalcarata]CAF2181155.1 unnamed protein product [Rotaria magnacalcarata]